MARDGSHVPTEDDLEQLRRLVEDETMTDRQQYDERHRELLEALARINLALEAVSAGIDRLSRLIADGNAKSEASLRFLVECWQEVRPRR
jgi:hypothetical protein